MSSVTPKLASALVAFAVGVTLLLGAPLHTLIPHEHSHAAGGEAIWSSLHSALRHEDKQFAATSAIVFLIAVKLLADLAFRYASLDLRVFDPDRGSLLRRGIHLYRRFS